jgi:excisionase family DNA binding protein
VTEEEDDDDFLGLPDAPAKLVPLTLYQPWYWIEHRDELDEAIFVASMLQIEALARHGYPRPMPAWVQTLLNLGGGLAGDTRLTLTVEEAAQLLGISRAFAYEAVKRGEIPHVRIGRRVLIPRAALERMLDVGSPSAAPDA